MRSFTAEIATALKNSKSMQGSKELALKYIKTREAAQVIDGVKAVAKGIKKDQKKLDNLELRNYSDVERDSSSLRSVEKDSFFSNDKFSDKYSDENLIEFLIKEDDSYYTNSVIDSPKDSILIEFQNLRNILSNKELLKDPNFIAKEIALFYSDSVLHNGENRGKVYNKKCEMFMDKFREDPDFFIRNNISAENILKFIRLESTYSEPKVVYHSNYGVPSQDTYKQVNEAIVALIYSSDTGTEIFVTADCDRNDSELLNWLGNSSVKNDNIPLKGQTNVDFFQKNVKFKEDSVEVVRLDLKHRSFPKILSNNKFGPNEKPIEIVMSLGTVEDSLQEKLTNTIVKNTLTKKYSEISKALSDSSTPKHKIELLALEIEQLQKLQSTEDHDIFLQITNMHKIIFNTSRISVENSDDYNEMTSELQNEVD